MRNAKWASLGSARTRVKVKSGSRSLKPAPAKAYAHFQLLVLAMSQEVPLVRAGLCSGGEGGAEGGRECVHSEQPKHKVWLKEMIVEIQE